MIFVLVSSPTMLIDGKAFAIDLEQQTIFENKLILEQNNVDEPKHNFITLHESVSVHTNDEKENNQHTPRHTPIQLRETIALSENSHDESLLVMIKGNDDRKTMMERIFDRSKLDRINFDSAKSSIENNLSTSSIIVGEQSEQYFADIELGTDQGLAPLLIDFSITSEQLETIYKDIGKFSDQLVVATVSLSSVDNPIFLLFVLPFAGFVLLRIENEKLNFNDLKRFFCYVFLTILISSAVITPMSISSSYWGIAYAEELSIDNQTSNDLPVVVEITPEPMEPIELPEPVELVEPIELVNSTTVELARRAIWCPPD